jgi:peptidoglycan/xylan/chitin deacetylase (PgdA/CDA1 family)
VKAIARSVRGAARRLVHAAMNPLDPPIVVLVYHRVTSLSHDPLGLAVRPERFREQMRFLAARARTVRFETIGAEARGPAVAVTFDDGYADNWTEALPILEESGVPATFFVTSGYVGGEREFWWDELDALIPAEGPLPETYTPPSPTSAAAGGAPPSVAIAMRTAAERAAFRIKFQSTLRRLPPAPRESLLAALAAWSGRARSLRPEHRQLSVEEVGRLAARPLATIGSHGVSHTSFAALDPASRRAELETSKAALERWTGRAVTAFAYPFGERSDVLRDGAVEAAAAGYAVVALNQPGQARRGVDPRRIPRFVVRDWGVAEFERRLDDFRIA